MQYRKLGNTNLKASLLGMGCMRLPFINNDGSQGVDLDTAIELLQYAADNGINYFDTAFGYHGKQSEAILGEALEARRKNVIYVTKQPFWEMHDKATIRRNLENTLTKLRTDYIDFYLVHRVMPINWAGIQEREIFAEYENFKREGLIRHIGCSYHGELDTFKNVVEKYPWDLVKVQHNMLDMTREVTPEGIEFAGKHGMGIAIMEPLRGGGLAYAPTPVKAVYDNASPKRTPAEWAFRHLVDMPEITTIVSGMTTMEQLKENIAMFSQADMLPCTLTDGEKGTITAARKAYESIVTIPCTTCNYCIPCPAGVQIPNIFTQYNDAHRFEHFIQPRRAYWFAKNAGGDFSKCTGCKACLKKCPQEIDVIKELQTAHNVLDGWKE